MSKKPAPKRVLITGGAVYGALDDNKIVSNRVRGIWAVKFGEYLAKQGYAVTLLVPDTLDDSKVWPFLDDFGGENVFRHNGFHSYSRQCEELAPKMDAAVMAAAVVNWIPTKPFPGKMPTKGYREGDIVDIPFILAPRVINSMRTWNPQITLIGCKMLIDSTQEELMEASHDVLRNAKCNVVVANDPRHGLKVKQLVYPDGTVVQHKDDFTAFFEDLRTIIDDAHWHTAAMPLFNDLLKSNAMHRKAMHRFDAVVDKYRSGFTPRGGGYVFGSVLVEASGGFLTSPREKGEMFSSKEAAFIGRILPELREVRVGKGAKATMNAPLLARVWEQYRPAAVLHLHEMLADVPTVPYGPPGTDRDNLREIPGPTFNIAGHGFIACLDENLDIIR